MKTVVTDSPEEAAEFIRRGDIVAFPTETVYGLGANLFDERAIASVFAAKGRPSDNPVIAHVGDRAQIEIVARAVTPTAKALIDVFFPGPLTVVLDKQPAVPMLATAGLDTVGIRMPSLAAASRFIRACGVPLAAPSANVSGRPSPTTWTAVLSDLDGKIPCILRGERTDVGLESTVVDCTGDVPLVLRAGGISLEALRAVVPSARLAIHDEDETRVRSPGTRHRHYAPRARVVLVDTPSRAEPGAESGYIGLDEPNGAFGRLAVVPDAESYARALFEFFRECDSAHIQTIYCQAVDRRGIGLALMDRIERSEKR